MCCVVCAVQVLVGHGTEVRTGDDLVIIEAMKVRGRWTHSNSLSKQAKQRNPIAALQLFTGWPSRAGTPVSGPLHPRP